MEKHKHTHLADEEEAVELHMESVFIFTFLEEEFFHSESCSPLSLSLVYVM